MTLLFLFLSLTSFASDLPHEDPNFGCFTQEEAGRYVRDFTINLKSFGGLELCDNSKDTKKLLNDLYLIEKTEFGAPVDHSFIRGFVDRENYYDWMKGETRSVNRGHDIPYATAYNSGGHFTMQDGWAVLSTLGRVGTIIHEARHTAGYRHYRCNFGPYAASSVSGCDINYSQGGSHGVEMEYYARVVLEAKNLHPVYKSMARLMALGRSNFVFNEMPMQKREALLLANESEAYLLDGDKENLRNISHPGKGFQLKRTSHGASFFNGRSSFAIDLYAEKGLMPGSDDYSYLKLFQIPRDQTPIGIRATEEVDKGNLRFLAVLGENGKIYSYNFPQGKWHAPSFDAVVGARDFVTMAPTGQSGLFVVNAAGDVIPVDIENLRFQAPLKGRWPNDVVRYAKLGDGMARLLVDGRVESEKEFPLPNKRFTQMINVPLYDAFEIVP
jgi:hypothetical protein